MLRDMLTALTIPLVYEFVGQVRKWLQLPYVPIYFQFLPFEALNSDLSVYLGDDYFVGPSGGPSISKREAERLKRRIQYTGALSIAIAALALPGVTAFVAAQYMPTSALWLAVGALSVAQLSRIRLAIRDFWSHAAIADRPTYVRLRLVYVLYLAVALFVFHTAYTWTRPYVERSDYLGLAGALFSLFVGKVLVSGILLAIAAAAFLKDLTERHVPALDDDDPDTQAKP